MAFFTQQFRNTLRDTVQNAILVTVMLFSVWGLNLLEHWFREQGQPAWMVLTLKGVSALVFITDMIALACICGKLIVHMLADTFRRH